jgi:hypothetical protein
VIFRAAGRIPDAQRDHIYDTARQLEGEADVWVLYDEEGQMWPDGKSEGLQVSPKGRKRERAMEQTLRDLQAGSPAPIHILAYDRVDQLKMWPLAREHLALESPTHKINYHYHDFSIAFWHRLCGAKNYGDDGEPHPSETQPYAAWFFENDAAFSGNVREFISFYGNKSEDYISSHYGFPRDIYPRGAEPFFRETKLGQLFPEESIYWKPEHVERYSNRLMSHMEIFISGGFEMFGESWAITSCKVAFSSWCTARAFKDDNFTG